MKNMFSTCAYFSVCAYRNSKKKILQKTCLDKTVLFQIMQMKLESTCLRIQ